MVQHFCKSATHSQKRKIGGEGWMEGFNSPRGVKNIALYQVEMEGNFYDANICWGDEIVIFDSSS